MRHVQTVYYKDSFFTPASIHRDELQHLIGVFSRGLRAFRNAPSMKIFNSPTLQNIISTLTQLGFDQTDPGCKIVYQLYLRMKCVREIHPTTIVQLLHQSHCGAHGTDAYHGTRTFCSYHVATGNIEYNLLDQEQIFVVQFILHCFHVDIVVNENTHKMHFIAQISTYSRDVTSIFQKLNKCILQYQSEADYHCSPLVTGW